MIHRTAVTWQTPEWQKAMAEAFSTPNSLLEYLELPNSGAETLDKAAKTFSMRVPRHFADLMEKGKPNDPLLMQVLPSEKELEITPGYSTDPVGDLGHLGTTGVLHKYHGRALLITSESCGINCRFCFRRHFPYSESSGRRDQFTKAITYLEQSTDVEEVILSGGDPLTLADEKLAHLSDRLQRLKHLKRLRIHSRLPVALPSRITHEFLSWFSSGRLTPVLVLHINHPRELSPELMEAVAQLRQHNIRLLSQTVLLKGINASLETLVELFQKLFEGGIQPYYLHLFDPVQGAAHFDCKTADARILYQTLMSRLSGYLVPKLVREIDGEPSKTLMF